MEEEELQFDFTPVTFFSVTGQGWVRETTFLPETSARYGGCAERDMDRVNYKGDLCGIIGSLVLTPLCSQLN